MTRDERAAQIWPLLCYAAINRQTITYETVSSLIGVPAQGLGPLLEIVQRHCLERDLPPLTSIVVSDVTGMPQPGFSAAEDVPRAQAAVFRHGWLEEQSPSPEMLTAGR